MMIMPISDNEISTTITGKIFFIGANIKAMFSVLE
jgi:hypothetical protein